MSHQIEAGGALPAGRAAWWSGRGDKAPLVWRGRAFLPIVLPLLLLLVWSVSARYELISPLILPPPSLVLQTAVELIGTGQLQSELAISFLRVVQGLLLAVVLAIPLGIAMGRSKRVDAYLGPFIRAIWFVPSLGWIPFLMLFLGISEALKITVIAKACFLPLLVNSYESARILPRRLSEVGDVLELSRFARLRFIVLPAMAPALFTGFRTSVGKGWQALVVVEMIASASGIGYLMTWGRTMFQLDILIVVVIVIGLAGWALDYGLLHAQTWLGRKFPRG
ncbi:ABC transporter permease [Aureimonas fodinaquatilis]|uniref:ABC transporter permease n=1 Tax=Aureimonas fodinaquatilis TaxID=2565783 RepID=A0A5B0E0X1_9HYPH|nr:ABC transporter permease [Aureimonas fodinaquatilis]KAA0971109.1 ABC transporter permease [Aureimonas fodinaquatilis]